MKTRNKIKKGQAIAEYLLLTALIAIGSVAVLQVVGANISVGFSNVSRALEGSTEGKIKGQEIKKEHYKVRDMGDFTDAISDTSQKK